MDEFVKFLTQFNFVYPEADGAAVGLRPVRRRHRLHPGAVHPLVRPDHRFNFIVAVWMVHWTDPVPGIWPAAILIFLGLYFGLRGSGRYGLDAMFEGSPRRR